jgi:sec-independent protein translocase protein TatA
VESTLLFCAFVGMPGHSEVLIILFVVLLLFGGKKLPELARSLGRSLGEFKRGREDSNLGDATKEALPDADNDGEKKLSD